MKLMPSLITLSFACVVSSGFAIDKDTVTVTEWTTYSLGISATTTNPTKASTPDIDNAIWRRVGDTMEINYAFAQSSGGAGGSGGYLFALPSGYSIDSSKVYVSTDGTIHSTVGSALVAGYAGYVSVYDSTHLVVYFFDGISSYIAGSSNGASLNGSTFFKFNAEVPISGWTTRKN